MISAHSTAEVLKTAQSFTPGEQNDLVIWLSHDASRATAGLPWPFRLRSSFRRLCSAMPELSFQPETLPAPSAEMVLLRVQTEAFLGLMGRRKGERFLRLVAEKLAEEESLCSVFQIRPTSQYAAAQLARQQAAEIFKRYMPLFLARLPPK